MKLKSFTLIELLVVISIISLLVLIVFSGLRRTTDRAKIAKVLQYQASLHRNLGADIAGWWQFDESLNDISGNENHGRWKGAGNPVPSEKWVDGVPGKQGHALEFSETSDYIEVPHSEILSSKIFGTSDFFTLEAWVYPKAWTNYSTVMNKATGGYWSNTTAGLWSYSGGFRCVMGSNVTGNPSGSYIRVRYKPELEKWHHIVCTADGTHLTMYVNGVSRGKIAIEDLTHSRSENTAPLVFGRRTQSYNESFPGLIGEIRIYSAALTSKETRQRYVKNSPGYLLKKPSF